jgi:hypothetical protein
VRAADRLNSDFFKGGQVGIPEVYYDTDISGYLAFDWAYKGLEAGAREETHADVVLSGGIRQTHVLRDLMRSELGFHRVAGGEAW